MHSFRFFLLGTVFWACGSRYGLGFGLFFGLVHKVMGLGIALGGAECVWYLYGTGQRIWSLYNIMGYLVAKHGKVLTVDDRVCVYERVDQPKRLPYT